MSGQAPAKGGHDTWGGGSNAMWECIFWGCDEVGQAGKLMTWICSFVFWLSGWGGGGWNNDKAH